MSNTQYTMYRPTEIKYSITQYSIKECSQMIGLLMSDDGLC